MAGPRRAGAFLVVGDIDALAGAQADVGPPGQDDLPTGAAAGPLEAINGLLLFGLSTAVMFAVMSRLIAIRLHLHDVH